jgi:hypothetical protein
MIWRERGSKVEDVRWKKVPICYDMASAAPRNPLAWSLHSQRAVTIHELLRQLAPRMDALQLTEYRGKVVEATRTASRLYPTNSELHARLALASAEILMFNDAVTEANEALRLDRITPHPDKRLPEDLRRRLEDLIPKWSATADKTPASTIPP